MTTEHVCTNPEHDHFDPNAFNPQQLATLMKAKEAYDAARALPNDETKVLCAGQALFAANEILREVLLTMKQAGIGPNLLAAVSGALALNGLAGASVTALAESHEDWHASGDHRVDAVFTTLAEALDSASQPPPMLSVEDLPEDMAKRLIEGKATEADQEAVRKIAVEKGLVPEDAKFDLIAMNLDTGEQHPLSEHPLDAGEEVYGQYL
jgi:hypothetical protein